MEQANLYEAMFLVDSGLGGSEFAGLVQEVSELIRRHGGAIKQIQRWAERKLAYDIQGLKRGLYLLVHFEAAPESIAELRRDIYLRERLVRVLILRVNTVSEPVGECYDESGEPVAAAPAEEPEAAAPAEEPEAAAETAEALEPTPETAAVGTAVEEPAEEERKEVERDGEPE